MVGGCQVIGGTIWKMRAQARRSHWSGSSIPGLRTVATGKTLTMPTVGYWRHVVGRMGAGRHPPDEALKA